jgi:hypothetical protein
MKADKLIEKMVRDYKQMTEKRAELQQEYINQLEVASCKLAYYAEQASSGRFYPTTIQDSTTWLKNTMEAINKVEIKLEAMRWVELYIEELENKEQ